LAHWKVYTFVSIDDEDGGAYEDDDDNVMLCSLVFTLHKHAIVYCSYTR